MAFHEKIFVWKSEKEKLFLNVIYEYINICNIEHNLIFYD